MNLRYEKAKLKNGYRYIIGCDEVGRGSLAGPVVACAVVLDLSCKIKDFREIRDSKLVSAKNREKLSGQIKKGVLGWAIGRVDEKVIDEINIHNATLLALKIAAEKALQAVPSETYLVCVDGKFVIPDFEVEQEAIVGGDNKIFSIAAASIVAKVYRDSLMKDLDITYPDYGFAKHKGYGTLYHRQAIKKFGLSPLHRRTFCTHLV